MRSMDRIAVAVAAAVFLVATTHSVQAEEGGNAQAWNRQTLNGINMNRLALNGVNINRLALNATSLKRIASLSAAADGSRPVVDWPGAAVSGSVDGDRAAQSLRLVARDGRLYLIIDREPDTAEQP